MPQLKHAPTNVTKEDVPAHVNGDSRYELREIMYLNVHGLPLWTDRGPARALVQLGDTLTLGSPPVAVKVRRVALYGTTQYVNVEPNW